MTLLNTYVINTGQIGKFLDAIREGQAPEKFNRQHLKDLGFTSSNHLAFLPLLKGLNFLTADGTPTQRYKDYLDRSRSRKILGDALREAYSDIFTLRANPKREDRDTIAGKYRSTYNTSANSADLAAKTFLGLLEQADISGAPIDSSQPKVSAPEPQPPEKTVFAGDGFRPPGPVGLHYNIQIHLYAVLFAFENEVRSLIRDTLEEKAGADWWGSDKVPAKVRQMAESRKEQAKKDSWLEGAKEDNLEFVDFGDLANIIIQNWETFKEMIPGQNWLTQRMSELEKARNFVAHNRMLLPNEFDRIYMYISDWNKVVGI